MAVEVSRVFSPNELLKSKLFLLPLCVSKVFGPFHELLAVGGRTLPICSASQMYFHWLMPRWSWWLLFKPDRASENVNIQDCSTPFESEDTGRFLDSSSVKIST